MRDFIIKKWWHFASLMNYKNYSVDTVDLLLLGLACGGFYAGVWVPFYLVLAIWTVEVLHKTQIK